MNKFELKGIIKLIIASAITYVICYIAGAAASSDDLKAMSFIPTIFICLIMIVDILFKNKRIDEPLDLKNGIIYFGIALIVTFILTLIINNAFDEYRIGPGSSALPFKPSTIVMFFSLLMEVVLTIYLKLWQYPLKSKEYIILLVLSDVFSVLFAFLYGTSLFLAIACFIALKIFMGGSSSKEDIEKKKRLEEEEEEERKKRLEEEERKIKRL